MPRETQCPANVAVVVSSKSDIYREVATGIAQLLAVLLDIIYVVAVSTRETLSRDAPKHLGGTW